MKKFDEQLMDLSKDLNKLSEKAANASAEVTETRELAREAIEDKISTAKGDLAAFEDKIDRDSEEKLSKIANNMLKAQMTIRGKIQNIKDAHDKRVMENYIDDRILHLADLYVTVDYLLSEANLTVLETVAAVAEYNDRFGEEA